MEVSDTNLLESGTAPQPAQNLESPTGNGSNNNDKNNNDKNPKKNNARKRTKTGCLTCRKRRIKCDEGKPTCNNCIKSKRMCEGYNQRVVFKDVHGGPFPGHPLFFPPQDSHGFYMPRVQKMMSSQGPLPAIAPKPRPLDFHGMAGPHYGMPYPSPGISPTHHFASSSMYEQPNSAISAPNSAVFGHHGMWPPEGHRGFNAPLTQYPPEGDFPTIDGENTAATAAQLNPTHSSTIEAPSSIGVISEINQYRYPPNYPQSIPVPPEYYPTTVEGGNSALLAEARDELEAELEYEEMSEYEDSLDGDEGGDQYDLAPTMAHHQELGLVAARGARDAFGIHQRTFGFPSDNLLSSYTTTQGDSPLNDPQAASVFKHFISVTGPSMSLYERHPYDPSAVFQDSQLPKSRRHIWSYAFPLLSFQNPALLHAMLALGNLQVATYHGVPPTDALRHYHLALRKVKRAIRGVNKRTSVATLAATLLLGYFEVWSSDHDKWCKHLMGSRLILKEVNFPEMTRAYLAARDNKRKRFQEVIAQQKANPFLQSDDTPEQELYRFQDADFQFVRELAGGPLAFEFKDSNLPHTILTYTDNEMESYEQLADLYWWYAKMDAYQSVLSGASPLMDFRLWTQVPPRAPIGRIDAIYGTYDHLLILLGRVANFAAKDMARKRKAMAAHGGGPPGGPPGGGLSRGPPGHKNGHHSPPTFPGMIPRRNLDMSTMLGFSPPRESSPSTDEMEEEVDFDTATRLAVVEWQAIREAFAKFQARLSEDFQPLDPEFSSVGGGVQGRISPFGPVRTYRTFSIAGIWMNLYMGLIVLYRAHPQMPPVAMMAAGMMAKDTWEYAAEIGRIAAGLADDVSHLATINTIVAAAFIESCFCLFVAGIQYRELSQRHWVITRLQDIARLTGWQSARQIADGCESAWTKAAAMGAGPAYHPPEGLKLFPVEASSIWINPRRVDKAIRKNQEHRLVLHKSEQAHYALGLLGVEQDFQQLELDEKN